MTATLRDRLAAVLEPDDATAYARADAVLELLARETQCTGICGDNSPNPMVVDGITFPMLCDLGAGHVGMHEGEVLPYGGRGHWPNIAEARTPA